MASRPRVERRAARLRLHRRIVPFAALMQIFRWIWMISLFGALVVAGYRFFAFPSSLNAFDFTQHLVKQDEDLDAGVLGVASGDMNGDGRVDLISAGNDGVKVFLQSDSGTFPDQQDVDSADGDRVQVVDLDNDSDLDILVALDSSPYLRWYRNDGASSYDAVDISLGGGNAKAFAADLTADGIADIATLHSPDGETVRLRVRVNDGTGSFSATTLSTDSGATAITAGDLDGDGYHDIITAGAKGLQRWDTNDGISWSSVDIDETADKNRTHLAVADVTGDGINDVITGDQHSDRVAVYRFVEEDRFDRIDLTGDADATTVEIVDLESDGDNDIVVASQDENVLYWYKNIGSSEFEQSTLASGLQSVFSVDFADIDGDGDQDFITGDHFQAALYWYERTAARPVATAPSNIQQTTDGAGRVTFDTTISDGDLDTTRARIQYSVDGDHWYKPWLMTATPAAGSVDLKNSNGYQVGTTNPIDTDANDSVKVTLLWDTKSNENTGGPIVGDVDSVQLRVIPNDGSSNGSAAISGEFRVDNEGPQGIPSIVLSSISETEATLSWDKPSDSSLYSYKIYYGTSHSDVLSQASDVWDSEDDSALDDVDTTSTTITGLTTGSRYSFKLYVEDVFGNITAPPSVQGVATTASSDPVETGVGTPTPVPTDEPVVTPTPIDPVIPTATPEPSTIESPTPTPSPEPTLVPTTFNNTAPIADAGLDQAVNPSALVILDGSASFDPDNDTLSYVWRQLSGEAVSLISSRTATPSFSAGAEGETYIFSLTVRDQSGAIGTDTITIATRVLPNQQRVPVEVQTEPTVELEEEVPVLVAVLRPIDVVLLILSIIATAASLTERGIRKLNKRSGKRGGPSFGSSGAARGTIVHYKTGKPIASAQVLVYGGDGKLRQSQRTNQLGEFNTLFPAGQYKIQVQVEGFAFAPAGAAAVKPEGGILYSGGKLNVSDESKPIRLVIPMKPIGAEVSSLKTQALHAWQFTQRIIRLLSWPIFVAGALANTTLIFLAPSILYLGIELLYVGLVIVKVALEVRVRPAFGVVRDAITHVPLDLAVVRLYEQGTNRLIMTRVTNVQGKFFALPPAGTYIMTVTKPGYGLFTKQDVEITGAQDSVLQITADLMPLAPQSGGLATARSAVL